MVDIKKLFLSTCSRINHAQEHSLIKKMKNYLQKIAFFCKSAKLLTVATNFIPRYYFYEF